MTGGEADNMSIGRCLLCSTKAIAEQWRTVDKGTAQQREKLIKLCHKHAQEAGIPVAIPAN